MFKKIKNKLIFFLIFLIFVSPIKVEAASVNLLKTSKFFVGQRQDVTGSIVSGYFDFDVFISERDPVIKSAFIEFSGVSRETNESTLDINLNLYQINPVLDTTSYVKNYSLQTGANSSHFKINYDGLNPFFIITVPGEYKYRLEYNLSGANVSLLGAKCTITYKYSLPSGSYADIGSLVSSIYDTGGESAFNNIWWDVISKPLGTDIKFQISSSSLPSGPWNFVGPDGTSASYYLTPGEPIGTMHNNNRYVRYKVFLSTTNPDNTPIVGSVTLNYSP